MLFESLKKSLLIIRRVRSRLAISLAQIEKNQLDLMPFEDDAADSLVDIISLVDFLHRYGAIADALPLISKQAPAMIKLKQSLADVVVARNYLQHIRSGLSKTSCISYPVLGAVLWQSGLNAYSLQFSQSSEADIKLRVYLDRHGLPQPQSKLRYRCKDKIIDIDDSIAQATAVYSWISQQVVCTDPNFAELKWGKTLLAHARTELSLGSQ